MRRAAKTDAAQHAIVKAMRKRGYTVACTHRLGNGYPDLHVSKDGLAVLVEVKSLGGAFTAEEQRFFADWQGPLIVAVTVHDVIGWFEEHERQDDNEQHSRNRIV